MEDIARLAANMVKRDLGIREATSRTTFVQEQVLNYSEELMSWLMDFVPTVGKVYTVSVDGVKYQKEARVWTVEGQEIVILGNGSMYGAGDTGEPWVIVYVVANSMCGFNWANGSQHNPTLSIYEETETLTPINPKYLPEGGVGHTEIVQTAVLHKTVFSEWSDHSAVNGVLYVNTEEPISITIGKTYAVIIDGTKHVTVAKDDGYGYGFLGNLALKISGEYEDTGETWALANSGNLVCIAFADPAENEKSHTVEVYELGEVVHTIKVKYLPGVCLPVVELSTVIYTEQTGNTALSAEESAVLDTVAAQGNPFLLAVTIDAQMRAKLFVALGTIEVEGSTVYNGFSMFGSYSVFLLVDPSTRLWTLTFEAP